MAVRQAADRGPIGTLVGVVTGGLVGLLGGPVGVAVGAYVGGTGGILYDLFNAGFDGDVVDEVAAALTPGKAAVVADDRRVLGRAGRDPARTAGRHDVPAAPRRGAR